MREIRSNPVNKTAKTSSEEITRILTAWTQGDPKALDALVPIVHAELKRLARRYMRAERLGHTLETSALVNEAYLRLVGANDVQWKNRAHFFAVSARLMRQILVDYARSRGYQKRGGGAYGVSLDEGMNSGVRVDDDLIAVHEALLRLAEMDPRKGDVVELRFFGGLTESETAEVLQVSPETVRRDWRLAKAWLRTQLTDKNRE
jgi:RNA polymerase sigma factor (TIGR02999 family)